MAAPITNWVHEKGVVTEKDRIALERAQRIEKKQEKMGYDGTKSMNETRFSFHLAKTVSPPRKAMRPLSVIKRIWG